MLVYLSQLLGLKVYAADGLVGRLYDFYFEDTTWIITDVVAKKSYGADGKTIPFPIRQVKELKKQLKKIELNISKSKVINNPDYSQRTPLLHTYYVLSRYLGWPNILSIADAEDKAEGAIVSPEYTPHLRSIREVTGYRIKENGKDTSYIVNFLIDKNDWTIKFTIVNMRKFLPGGKKALISTSNVNLDPKDPTAILAE